MSMISQWRFHVHIGGKKSPNRSLLNGLPQGSVNAHLLFNLYTHDIPPTTSKKYIYADDIALKTCHKDFPEIERVLLLKLNTTETVSSVFHLANRRADCKLNIQISDERLPFERTLKYLSDTLDRNL